MIPSQDTIPVEFWFLPGKKHKDGGRIGFLLQVWSIQNYYGHFFIHAGFQKIHEIERRGEKIHHRPLSYLCLYTNYKNQSVEAAAIWADSQAWKRISKWKRDDDTRPEPEVTAIWIGDQWFR